MTQATSEATTLFSTTAEAPTGQQPTNNQTSFANELVGEGKKFKDVDALAKSKLEADKFIEQLKSEKEEMRKELNKRLEQESILESLKQMVPKPSDNAAGARHEAAPSQEDIGKLVDERLSEREKTKTYEDNVMAADTFVSSKFANRDEASAFLDKKATELGINKKWLMDMAGRSPKALYSLLGFSSEAPDKGTTGGGSPAPIVNKSTVLTEANPSGGKKTKSHYEDIRKANPALYFSAKVQNEIFKSKRDGNYD